MKKKESPKRRGMGKERKVNVSKPKKAPNRRNLKILSSESEEEDKTVANKKTAKKNAVNPEESKTFKGPALTNKIEETETENATSIKDATTRQTILKLDSVEELLRKRREVKQKLEAKKTSAVSKTRAKG